MTTRVRPTVNKLKPVQLISFDQNKNLQLNQQAAQLINTFQQKTKQLAIIAVVGRYRTGKSYILNRVLLNQSSGFEVGPTVNACTKGLWVWPQLVEMTGANGQTRHVMLMDTEGLGSLEEGENTDTKIFLMSTLLSSFMVYNSVGSIDEKAIQGLGLIVNLSRMLQKNTDTVSNQQLVNCFPSFLWLVRDFYLRLENQHGQTISSTQYLQHALKMQKGRPETIDGKNAIRSHLREYFRERDCFTLVRPTTNDIDLQHLNTVPENRLRPEFVAATKKLKALISERVRPKSFRNKPCSPSQFIEMAKHFISAVNSGGIPSISSHWESVCSSESNRIISMFEKRHDNQIQDALIQGLPIHDIERIHRNLLNEGQKKIQQTFLPALEKQLKKKALKKTLKTSFEKVRKELIERSFQIIKASLQQTFLTLLQDVRSNKSQNFNQLCEKLEGVKVDQQKSIVQPNNQESQLHLQLYEKMKNLSGEFIGSMQEKWRLQNEMLKEKEQFCQATFNQRRAQMQDQIDYQSQKLRNFEALNYRQSIRIDSLTEDKSNLEQILEQERKAAEQTYKTLLAVTNDYQGKLIGKQEQVNELLAKSEKINHAKNSQLSQKCNGYERQLNAKEQEKVHFQTKCKQHEQEIENLQTKINEMECQLLTCNSGKGTGGTNAFYSSKLVFLTKQNQQLAKQLSNQKNMNESLVRSLQPQSSTVSLLNQIRTLESQNHQLNNKIRQLKLYEHTVLSCSQFRCRKCEGLFRFDQLNGHVCEQDQPLHFDVSFIMDGFTKEIVFIVEVARGDKAWKLEKSVKMINLMLRKFGQQDLADLQSAEGCEQSRIRIAELLEVRIKFMKGASDLAKTDRFLKQYLALDIHTSKVHRQVLSKLQPKPIELRKSKHKQHPRRLQTETNEQQGINWLLAGSKLQIDQQDQQNVNNENSMEQKNRNFMKTCKFDGKKQFMFPC